MAAGVSGLLLFFFQAEDGIRDLVRSRGLGDVYKRQDEADGHAQGDIDDMTRFGRAVGGRRLFDD